MTAAAGADPATVEEEPVVRPEGEDELADAADPATTEEAPATEPVSADDAAPGSDQAAAEEAPAAGQASEDEIIAAETSPEVGDEVAAETDAGNRG